MPVGADPQLAGSCLCSSRWSVLRETTIRLSSDLSWLGPVTALSCARLQSSGGPVGTLTRDRRPGAHRWPPGSGQGCRTRRSSGNSARQTWRIWPLVSQCRPSKGIPTRMRASESQWPSLRAKAKQDHLLRGEVCHQPLPEGLQRFAGEQGWRAADRGERAILGASHLAWGSFRSLSSAGGGPAPSLPWRLSEGWIC